MRSLTITRTIAGQSADVTKLIDILIIIGLTALMMLQFSVVPSMLA
jgi:hypothetical protein